MSKTIARLDPVSCKPVVESEEHYITVHSRFARNLYRDHMPGVLRYTPHKALKQYDLNGHFERKPGAWRFVVSEFSEDQGLAGLPEEYLAIFSQDHVNCIRDVRRCLVEETVLFDRRTGQTSFVKYLFEYDRSLDVTIAECDRHYEKTHLRRIPELLSAATGARLFVCNKVINEAEALPLAEPGQLLTGRLLPETDKYYYEEYLFDHEEWAEEFFSNAEVRGILQDRFFKFAAGYLVEERTGFDRR